ncbi:unnamed protein product [Prunus brigantina]
MTMRARCSANYLKEAEDEAGQLGKQIEQVYGLQWVLISDGMGNQMTMLLLQLWLSNLKNAASDVEDLLDSFISQETIKGYDVEDLLSVVRSAYRAFTSISFQITKGTPHAERIRKTLHIHDRLLEFNFREPSIVDRRSTIRETGSCVLDSKINGRDDDKEKLVKLLISS